MTTSPTARSFLEHYRSTMHGPDRETLSTSTHLTDKERIELLEYQVAHLCQILVAVGVIPLTHPTHTKVH